MRLHLSSLEPFAILRHIVTTPNNNCGLRDNHTRGTVADFLTSKIQNESRLSIVSAYFTIYAYDAMKQALDRIEHLDFLFGEPSFVRRETGLVEFEN